MKNSIQTFYVTVYYPQVTGRRFRPGPSAAISMWLKNANAAGMRGNFGRALAYQNISSAPEQSAALTLRKFLSLSTNRSSRTKLLAERQIIE